jgi:hypothetical protein
MVHASHPSTNKARPCLASEIRRDQAAHAYNPSYSAGGDQEDPSLRPAYTKIS